MTPTSVLFNPIQLGSKTIPSRIFMSALTRDRSNGTVPNDVMVEYYRQRAAGGAGLIVTEGTLISRQGTEWPNAPGIWNEDQIAGWKKVTDAVHRAGAHIYLQLWHVGRVAHPDMPEQKLAGVPVYAPSAVRARGGKFRYLPGTPGYVTPTAVEDPWTLVGLYKQAALNAKEAGFDGAEVQAAGGYLITQFLDSTSNKRADQWGGSIENRARFGLEVFKAVKEVFKEDVGIKVTPTGGYNDTGMPLQETLDTFTYFLSEIDKLKPAYVTLLRYNPTQVQVIDGKQSGTVHDVVGSYRPIIKNAKVIVNSGVTPEEGARLIREGKADAVFLGVPFISHPDLVKRVRHGKALDNVLNFADLYWNRSNGNGPEVGYTDYPEAEY